MKKIFKAFLDRIVHWLIAYNWRVVGTWIFLLIVLEAYEIFYSQDSFDNPFHQIELFIYIIILIFVGVLVDYLKIAYAAEKRNFDLLEIKHKISSELTEIEGWDLLIPKLVEIPGKFVAVVASCVRLNNPISGNFEMAAEWVDDGISGVEWNQDCPSRFLNQDNNTSIYSLSSTNLASGEGAGEIEREFCLPITYTNDLLALIQFRLRSSETISEEQRLMLESIIPEIALSLKANLEHKKLFEYKQTQLALSERHAISNYLHDKLSPNLAFLNLKLDQFISGEAQQSIDSGVSELHQMKEATNQSYDIVRKIIETIHTETKPRLFSLVDSQVKRVSKRSHIDISLEKKGKELPILPETQRTVFNVLQEALTNIERHSNAKTAKVVVEWGEDELTVRISDDGIGFDPNNLGGSEHLGLEIMRERVERLNGRVNIFSESNKGTDVTIFVPIEIDHGEKIKS